MEDTTTITSLHQPGSIFDPLTEIACLDEVVLAHVARNFGFGAQSMLTEMCLIFSCKRAGMQKQQNGSSKDWSQGSASRTL